LAVAAPTIPKDQIPFLAPLHQPEAALKTGAAGPAEADIAADQLCLVDRAQQIKVTPEVQEATGKRAVGAGAPAQ